MKILLFHTYNQGYLSSFFHEMAVRLLQERYEVVCFSWKATVSENIIDGVKVIVKKKKGYVTNYRNVYHIIKKEKPDIILSNFSYVNPALLFGKFFKVKKNIVWFHSLNEQMESTKMHIFIKKQFLKLADLVIANSFLTKEELHTYYSVPETKTIAIPFWSNISEQKLLPTDFKLSSGKNVIKIGCPGRMATHKNQKIILEALSALKSATNYEFQLYFAGIGEELSNLKQKTKDLNLSSEVAFLKHLSANDMIQFYKTLDVVVLPSLHEAFGLVFIEAISLGTPVIVSSQFGALSFIKDENNSVSQITFNPDSVKDLQDKLIPYFEKKGLPKTYFKELYHNHFNKDIIFKNFLTNIEINTSRT